MARHTLKYKKNVKNTLHLVAMHSVTITKGGGIYLMIKEFYPRLEVALAIRGFSLNELSEQLHISVALIQSHHISPLSSQQIKNISEFLDIEPRWLLGQSDCFCRCSYEQLTEEDQFINLIIKLNSTKRKLLHSLMSEYITS